MTAASVRAGLSRPWLLAKSALALLSPARLWLARAGALLPGACALCAATGPHALCGGCRTRFFTDTTTRCRRCALPLPLPLAETTSPACDACLQDRPAFDATVVAVNYAAPVDQLVLGLKFRHRLALAPLLSELMRDALLRNSAADMPLPDCLTAVPLGEARLRERGFNQTLEIARPLSLAIGVPLVPRMLERTRDTVAQSGLSTNERRLNLRGAFTVTEQAMDSVRGMHVGIVEDVMTTGETLNEIAATLKCFGATRVTNLVFARTLPPE